jgi:CIC family chloride channel protein
VTFTAPGYFKLMKVSQEAVVDGERVSVAPALQTLLEQQQLPHPTALVDQRTIRLCSLAIALGLIVAGIGIVLEKLIFLVVNLSFYGHFSFEEANPLQHQLGLWVILVPIGGAILIGLLARFGSAGIRGHGIPEAIEQVLLNESRIPARITLLKPLSAAISIGTGGPFGIEGPIIATGGAFGSLLGQLTNISADERKTLLAAGAAAGVAMMFGAPVAGILMAIELLLFEYRPRSLIPVAMASGAAAAVHLMVRGTEPIFALPNLAAPSFPAQLFYLTLGLVCGLAAVAVTKAVIVVEQAFERLPIHWMWWPALGAIVVGVVGWLDPRTLSAGYYNINDAFDNNLTLAALTLLGCLKLLSWTIAVGSGTSGGTLAPLFIIGSCLGGALGTLTAAWFPGLGIDPRLAALVGMAALFSGASRAPLMSIVIAFEITLQPLGLLPLLGGCMSAFLVSCLLLKQTLMTDKVERRGFRTGGEYRTDPLDQLTVAHAATKDVVVLYEDQTVGEVRAWLASKAPGTMHQGYPIVNEQGHVSGILTRRDFANSTVENTQLVRECLQRMPRVVYDDCSLRQAVEHMINHDIGRLPVLARHNPTKLVGILTRSDILKAYRRTMEHGQPVQARYKLAWRSQQPVA